MEPRLLRYSDPNLSPEARWLLLVWSKISGLDESLTCRRLELYRHLGMTHQHGRPALKELIEKGIVIESPIRARRGRPISNIQISSGFQARLRKLAASPNRHLPEIESLCRPGVYATVSQENDGRKSGNCMKVTKKLTPANCWLLMVLLAHAEAPGIITGLSQRQLASATGMTKERVRAQLAKLRTLGIIVRSEPGIKREHGAINLCSYYELDLTHPVLMGESSVVANTCIITSENPGETDSLSGFYEATVAAAKFAKNEPKIKGAIEDNFPFSQGETTAPSSTNHLEEKDQALDAMRDYKKNTLLLLRHLNLSMASAGHFLHLHELKLEKKIKAHLQSYALNLLTNHWKSLAEGHGKPDSPISSVMAAIQRDCSSLISRKIDGGGSRATNDFFRLLYSISFSLATQMQGCLTATNEKIRHDLSAAIFTITQSKYNEIDSLMIRLHCRNANRESPPPNHIYRPLCANLSLPPALEGLPPEITRELN
ncbi:MarR family transcriptional regulator [Marinobacter adhaerens]|uniref:MarR family transcriptional regulator n=1 Tax=Marinobacter adhaerens TaxID=1033846 RepID=A0A851I4A4_9GAMM|nr:helix-turn-helix domain-containing protein [Marinobacter adhaerens]NWN92878.1 MarR family transcriptional regulator [Marinobacter adhaerens]